MTEKKLGMSISPKLIIKTPDSVTPSKEPQESSEFKRVYKNSDSEDLLARCKKILLDSRKKSVLDESGIAKMIGDALEYSKIQLELCLREDNHKKSQLWLNALNTAEKGSYLEIKIQLIDHSSKLDEEGLTEETEVLKDLIKTIPNAIRVD